MAARTKNAGPRALKGFVAHLGILSTTGDLLNLANREDEKAVRTFTVCPVCDNSKMTQFYTGADCTCRPVDYDPDAKPGWTMGELHKGKEVDGKIVVLTDEDKEALKEGEIDTKVIDLSVSPADQFEVQTWPTGAAYWWEPANGKPDPGYTALVALANDRSKAVYGLMRTTAAASAKLYRLVPGPNGGLVLQEMLRPQETWHFEGYDVEINERDAQMAAAFADMVKEDFDPEAVRSTIVEKMNAIVAAKVGQAPGTTVAATPKPAAPKAESLADQLAAAIAVAQASKAS